MNFLYVYIFLSICSRAILSFAWLTGFRQFYRLSKSVPKFRGAERESSLIIAGCCNNGSFSFIRHTIQSKAVYASGVYIIIFS